MALKYLPRNYLRIAVIEPGADKRLSRRLDLVSLGIAAVMAGVGRLFVPFSAFFYVRAVTRADVLRVGALIPALLAYTLLYTLLRGIILRRIGGMKPGFGVSRLAPFVSSGAYLDKKEFSAAALLPPAVFAVIYFILGLALPIRWFWFMYILQMINVTGAVWDVYTVKRSREYGDDLLICDGGTCTEFFAKAELVEK